MASDRLIRHHPPTNVTLVNCADEPIRVPGSVQPHGALVVFDPVTWIIETVSENIGDFLPGSPESLVDETISSVLSRNSLERLSLQIRALRGSEDSAALQLATTVMARGRVDAVIYLQDDRVFLELDNLRPQSAASGHALPDIVRVQQLLERVGQPDTLAALMQTVVAEIRQLTSFDRTMIYRFHDDGHGEVVAEEVVDGWSSYLGLHYPESDIPAQARELYRLNCIRCITDVSYKPAALLSSARCAQAQQLDLSRSKLRSVSPIHLQYLQNMGVESSMSISLLEQGELWGMIVCHHRQPHFIETRVRTICELLGTTFSMMLLHVVEAEQHRELAKLQDIERTLLDRMARSTPFIDGAFKHLPNLCDLVNSDGASSASGGKVFSVGSTPSEEQVAELASWLSTETNHEVFASDAISEIYAPAKQWICGSCGVLAIEIARSRQQFLLCFRRERIKSIFWAGQPSEQDPSSNDLTPRTSFARWEQTVRDTSLEWKPMELRVAESMRRATLTLIVERAEHVAMLNRQLAQSNAMLQSFAEVVAHDLKEPLRGIHNNVTFIKDDSVDLIDEAIRQRLDRIALLANRGSQLTDALLGFAELGREPLQLHLTDLDDVLDQALQVLESAIDAANIRIVRPEPLPKANCDPIQIGQVFQNLISNAIKYRRDSAAVIEIGFRAHSPDHTIWQGEQTLDNRQWVVYVQDNGIGVPETYHKDIFRLFRRLHPRSQYGGGNGLGLAIAKRIVELHHGHIWVESQAGEGCTFYFTIGDPDTTSVAPDPAATEVHAAISPESV